MLHHRSLRTGRVLAAALVLAAAAAASPVRAGDVFFDATLRLPLGDDARMFLSVTRTQYAQPETQAAALVQRCRRPQEDYPTVMFLAAASRSPEAVLDLRLQGLPWSEVMTRLRIAPEPLFAGLDRDPGPPYGNAWGHWKNHRSKGHPALSDEQIVDLAKLQIASRACGTDPYAVIEGRHRGLTVEQVVAEKTRPERGREHGHGHDPGHGHGEGHGHRPDHDPDDER
jgi:hypothetical protein